VIVQGLGFVGSAMVAALTQAKDKNRNLMYNVIDLDLCDKDNYWKIARANEGKPPVISADSDMKKVLITGADGFIDSHLTEMLIFKKL
jgi:hypothetical protein